MAKHKLIVAIKKVAYFLRWLFVTIFLFCIDALHDTWDDNAFKKIEENSQIEKSRSKKK